MLFRSDFGQLFAKMNGLSNVASLGNQNWIALPKRDLEYLRINITYVCDEMERMKLTFSLASAKNLKKVIYEQAVHFPVK